MEYGKIIAVTGLPGLFELMSSKNDGAIVRSLEDKSTKFVSSRIHNFSHLESIEVFTVRDNVNLAEVFQAMEKSSDAVPTDKDNAQIKAYFEKTYPDLDFSRVYSSDLKKMVKWFNVLKANNVDIKVRTAEELSEETPDTVATEVNEAPAEKAEASKPKKSTAKKAETVDTVEEKPAKKAAPKKKKSEE
jgi:hypothetical protein